MFPDVGGALAVDAQAQVLVDLGAQSSRLPLSADSHRHHPLAYDGRADDTASIWPQLRGDAA